MRGTTSIHRPASSATELAIEVKGLRKEFRGRQALAGLDLAVTTGTVHGVLGPNGAGKTTLVRILSTLLRPSGGRALVAGYDVVAQPYEVRSRIGLTGQYAAVDLDLSGSENLVLLGKLHRLGRAAPTRATELIERFGLAEAAGRPVRGYSGGMRRRLDLAASLVGRPAVLFLDEPTTGLDPASRAAVWELVREQVTAGVTVLLTTQYLEEADQLADRITVMANGQVIAGGSPSYLKDKVGGTWLEVAVGKASDLPVVVTALSAIHSSLVHSAEHTVRLPLVDPIGDIAAAAHALSVTDVDITAFALRRPSLDEVFLQLTGNPVGKDAAV